MRTENGVIDFVYSEDDGGWYAQEYDFTRDDSATRVTREVYSSRLACQMAVHRDENVWEDWS